MKIQRLKNNKIQFLLSNIKLLIMKNQGIKK